MSTHYIHVQSQSEVVNQTAVYHNKNNITENYLCILHINVIQIELDISIYYRLFYIRKNCYLTILIGIMSLDDGHYNFQRSPTRSHVQRQRQHPTQYNFIF
ncbi:hypothetical protein QTP88_012476 [Uroleucon formosanum]